jgi:hypothetical protein
MPKVEIKPNRQKNSTNASDGSKNNLKNHRTSNESKASNSG